MTGTRLLHMRSGVLTLPEPGFAASVMGILNLTPDSFSDGGRYSSCESAESRFFQIAALGAAIIDIGGQSTRPGFTAISPEEETARIAPLLLRLEELRANGTPTPFISVDTFYPSTARFALSHGADMINDVTGLCSPEMREVIARYNAGCVLMHCDNVESAAEPADEIRFFFERRLEQCASSGIGLTHVCLDCGIGFGKTREQEYGLLKAMGECRVRELPMLAAASRKRITEWINGSPLPPPERDGATHRAHLLAAAAGADIVRVHDVAGARKSLRTASD